MWWFLALFLQIAVAHYAHNGDVLMPDPKLTPGATVTSRLREVCMPGYAKKIRNVDDSLRQKVYREYGQNPGQGICVAPGCECDHLIPLELGGSNDIRNLWPQPYGQHPGAREKDRLEDLLHEEVCTGQIPLATAQKRIAQDWYQLYLLSGLGEYHGPRTKRPRPSLGSH